MYPECCGQRMDFVSEISTGKFCEIITWRCSSCESEMVKRRSIENKKAAWKRVKDNPPYTAEEEDYYDGLNKEM